MDQQGRKDLEALLSLLPADIYQQITEQDRVTDLLEVVMDLGRQPSARYSDGELFFA